MFFDRIYYICFFFFFPSQNFKRGGALAPSMDAPPLLRPKGTWARSEHAGSKTSRQEVKYKSIDILFFLH